MITLADNITNEASAVGVRFEDNRLYVTPSDSREISLPIDKIEWLGWSAKATPEQRPNWSIEPNGFALYWEDLDDGIESCHLSGMQPLT